MIDDIISRLEALIDQESSKALFSTVGDALEASNLSKIPRGGAAAYVVPLSESAESNSRQTGPVLQRVTESVGVIHLVQIRNDLTGSKARDKLKPYCTATRAALLGQVVNSEYTGFEFVSGEILSMDAGAVVWMDTYGAQTLIAGV